MLKRKVIATEVARALGVIAAGVISVSGSVVAQENVQRVEITGSSISRIAQEGALPVQNITRADIEKSGAQSVTELIQSLPAMQGFTRSSESVGGGGGGFSGASLHNIGETRTLVLLNGRRVATWAGQTLTGAGAGIDLNSIPLAAIERVEVLTDGASTLYGADAVAGVVNFILRNNMTQGEASIKVSQPKAGVGRQVNVSVVNGWGDLQESGSNFMIAASREKEDLIKATDRDFAKTGVIPFSEGGKKYVFFNGSLRGAPANFSTDASARDPSGDSDLFGSSYQALGGTGCPPQHVFRGGACRFDYATTIEIQPESSRDNVIAAFSGKFGEHIFGADFAWSKFQLTSRIAPPPVDMAIPQSSQLYANYISPLGGQVGDELFAYWRGIDAGGRTTEDTTTALHAALTLKGQLAGWDYNSALTHSTNTWVERHTAGWLKQNEMTAAIDSGAFDPFKSPGQQTASGQAAIEGMKHVGEFKRQTSTLDMFELRGATDAFSIGNQKAQFGAGFDLRRETVKYVPSDIAKGVVNTIAGDSSQEQPYDVSRSSAGAFAELLTPFSKSTELTTSVRFDHYSDFGNTTNLKLAGRFQPSKELLVRASAGTGFRAPSVPQVSAGRQLYGVTGNTYGCPNAALVAAIARDPGVECRPPESQYEVFASGNSELKPEKSVQASLGVRFEPSKSASIGVDLWAVNVEDRISQLTEDTVMSDPTLYAKNFTVFDDPGTGKKYVALYLPNENLGKEHFRGLDLDATVRFTDSFSVNMNWTHMLKYGYQRLKNGEWYSNLGKFNDDAVTFRNVLRLTSTLKMADWEHVLIANYKSGYTDQVQTAEGSLIRNANPDGSAGSLLTTDMVREVEAYVTLDFKTTLKYDKALTFSAGIINLTDEDPPLSLKTSGGHQLGYDNRYTDPRGRTWQLNVSYKF